MAITRNYKYKILQDIDLSQNTIENPSKITNASNINIHSDSTLTEDASSVIVKNSTDANKITVDATHTQISGTKLDVSTPTTISGATTISNNLTLTGSTITATTPSTINIGKSTGDVNILGNELEIKSKTSSTSSSIHAENISFDNKLQSNDISIYWDATHKSIVFTKED